MTANLLQRPALVLNRNWQPVNVATVERALVLLFNESARAVDPADYQTYQWEDWSKLRPRDGEPFIQAVRFRVRVPEVIALVGYDRLPSAAVAFSRRNLFKRDRYTCQYCGAQPGSEELSIDHVVPRAQGGQSRWDNCVLACLACNHRKADRTPQQAGMRLRRPPVQPAWHPLYGLDQRRIESWSKFVSEAYWNVRLAT
jgi:5-methylcytosine-specific restriction endonuclease McrA